VSALRLLAGALLVLLCGAVGYKKGHKYVLRDIMLSDFVLLCDYMCGDISFFHKPLVQMLEDYSGKTSPQTAELVRAYLGCLEDGASVEILREKIPVSALSAEDRETVIGLFSVLGRTDEEAQLAAIRAFRLNLADKRADAAERRKKYAALYPKLGALAGACMAVLIL
jgi:stage III sporulation protein AB